MAADGPGLAFIVYPTALAMTAAPRFLNIVFFVTIFFVGLDSQFINIEGFVTSVQDRSQCAIFRRPPAETGTTIFGKATRKTLRDSVCLAPETNRKNSRKIHGSCFGRAISPKSPKF